MEGVSVIGHEKRVAGAPFKGPPPRTNNQSGDVMSKVVYTIRDENIA